MLPSGGTGISCRSVSIPFHLAPLYAFTRARCIRGAALLILHLLPCISINPPWHANNFVEKIERPMRRPRTLQLITWPRHCRHTASGYRSHNLLWLTGSAAQVPATHRRCALFLPDPSPRTGPIPFHAWFSKISLNSQGTAAADTQWRTRNRIRLEPVFTLDCEILMLFRSDTKYHCVYICYYTKYHCVYIYYYIRNIIMYTFIIISIGYEICIHLLLYACLYSESGLFRAFIIAEPRI